MNISEIENGIISEFEIYDDWMDKYNFLIECGKNLQPLSPEFRQEKYLIKGCQSQVWLVAKFSDGTVVFEADSDALITKGIVSLLIRALSGQSPDEIIKADLQFIDAIGLKEHLSQTRANGLVNMIKQMKLYATAFKAQRQSQE